ncbi:hypothetical protein CL176_01490 [Suicoccus acidiformans]|uniref:ABC transmembrane type-1 domain-containing protein n=1 Tax=Suicoccus acidiformans TaxID=2036206 RepID=A0A347WI87_9LACT|nr:hypothetical protein [Suicoccus acidiformans]AXY24794.1 hypothetical protein CL176_01490 [Suicoccus acidiformans]
MRILIAYLRKYWPLLIGQLSFETLWAASQLAIPRLMVNVIDAGVAQGNMELIVQNGLYMIGATLINIAALLINVYFLTQLNGVSPETCAEIYLPASLPGPKKHV